MPGPDGRPTPEEIISQFGAPQAAEQPSPWSQLLQLGGLGAMTFGHPALAGVGLNIIQKQQDLARQQISAQQAAKIALTANQLEANGHLDHAFQVLNTYAASLGDTASGKVIQAQADRVGKLIAAQRQHQGAQAGLQAATTAPPGPWATPPAAPDTTDLAGMTQRYLAGAAAKGVYLDPKEVREQLKDIAANALARTVPKQQQHGPYVQNFDPLTQLPLGAPTIIGPPTAEKVEGDRKVTTELASGKSTTENLPQTEQQKIQAEDMILARVGIEKEVATAMAGLVDKQGRPLGINPLAVAADLKSGDPIRQQQAGLLVEMGRKKVQADRVAQSAAQGLATEQFKMGLPVGFERNDLVHPDTLASPPPDMTKKQAMEAGYVKITDKQKEQIAGVYESKNLVDQLFAYQDKLITAKSAAEVPAQAAALSGGAALRTNPVAKAYNDTKEAFLGQLARNLGGERGVLTEGDIGRIRTALSTFTDTVESKALKQGVVRSIVETGIEAKRAQAVGKLDVLTDSKARIQGLIDRLEQASAREVAPGVRIRPVPSGRR